METLAQEWSALLIRIRIPAKVILAAHWSTKPVNRSVLYPGDGDALSLDIQEFTQTLLLLGIGSNKHQEFKM